MSQFEKFEEEDLFCDYIEKDLQALKINNKKELHRKKFTMIVCMGTVDIAKDEHYAGWVLSYGDEFKKS